MEHFFVALFQSNFSVFRYWGIPIVFAIAFLESLPFLGAIIPGQVLIIFAGFLIKLGIFGFWPALFAAISGAALADILGFYFGKKYGPQIVTKKIWLLEKRHIEKTMDVVKSNSVKSIFIGRLHSFTRAFMPFAAGISRIDTKKFILIDIASSIVWATGSLAIGFIFGKSFELAAMFIGKFFLISTLIAIIIIAAISHMKAESKKIASLNAVLLGVSVSFLYLFTITANGFASGKLFYILDTRVEHIAIMIQNPILTYIMLAFTTLGGPIILPALSSIFILFLLYKKRWSDAAFAACTMSIGIMLVNLLKALFQRARPLPLFANATGTSFPSGHAAMAAIAAIVLYFVCLRKIKNDKLRAIYIFTSIIVAFAIGLSRVYLNVHWASDVLGGFFLGIFFATFAIVVFRLTMFIIKKSKKEKELPDIL